MQASTSKILGRMPISCLAWAFSWACIQLLFFCLLTAKVQAQVFVPIVAEPKLEKYRIQRELYYLDNSRDSKSVSTILSGDWDETFARHDKYGLNVGYPQNVQEADYWLGLLVENKTGHDIALYLAGSAKPSLSRVYFLKNGIAPVDHIVEISQIYDRANLNINIKPGVWKIYIEMSRDPFGFQVVFPSLRSYDNIIHHSPEKHFISLSLGICIALLIYNLVLATTLRSRSHYLYVCYNFSIVLYFEGNSQLLAEQFGFFQIPRFAMLPISSCSIYFFIIFVYDILNVKDNMPRWKWVFYCLFALWPVMLLIHIFDPQAAIALLNPVILSSFPLSLAVGTHAILKKIPIARLLLVTVSLPAIGSFIGLQAGLFDSVLPIVFIACAQPLGINLEMIFLSMIVGYKVRKEHQSLRNKRDQAYNELKKIVYPHQVEDVWNGKSLEDTMPVGRNHAYTLVFDVIASSKIALDNPRAFLSKVFHECSEAMMDQYDGKSLVANAYRVKELGDGFLCTVGFPFACPSIGIADHTVALAIQFMKVFSDQVRRVEATVPIHCCIGIAYGPVEAFFPESGAKVYDLFGKGIILAHRYESMRDLILPIIKQKASLIILQEQVFRNLSEQYQQQFALFNLAEAGLSVRDDELATTLYYSLQNGESEALPTASKAS